MIVTETDISNYSIDYDIEACALKTYLGNTTFHIVTIYRSPTGDFDTFLENLENVLEILCNTKTEVTVCGDFNIS
jgi:exonuclease III